MSLCRIKNHHSSFRNLKLKRLIWQRSVYCENECHNKIVLFIHTGRNITINMDIIQMFFYYYYHFSSLRVVPQHTKSLLSTFPSTHCEIVTVWTFRNPNQSWIFCLEMRRAAGAKHQISKWRTRNSPGLQTNMAKSNLNEEAAIIILMSSF